MKTIREKEKEIYKVLKDTFHYKGMMAAPRITKIVVASSTGTGMKKDKHRNELVIDRLTKITGQKAVTRKAKKSVAAFKIRQGEEIGVAVTLRGKRMYTFIDKLYNIALPRTKDFRGINTSAVDSVGNLTIGIKEHTIFPEIVDEELKDVFGLAVTVVTTAKSKEEALAFFKLLGTPFKKDKVLAAN
jgi:large subunit ribosomal protein L5